MRINFLGPLPASELLSIFLTSSGTDSMAVDGDNPACNQSHDFALAILMPLDAFAVFCTENARWLTTIYTRAHSSPPLLPVRSIQTLWPKICPPMGFQEPARVRASMKELKDA
jgi:hypothetical protein